ncbi:hypothetical protein [Flavobacterium salmonis]|uniref:Uncharacterized protein n=1 Tax=Flavobacterium salmonis TaxID=2654844 RepID=A0A6V6Z6L0_9FLAO|nr:hypothetical protein [Flavobacterium salmonis]CAD0006562.1 hypothetical protein FLAT13_03345 [Flavobacterium salmonis]
MKITSITGVSKSPELNVTKSIGSLILASSLEVSELTTEKISIYIERANGSNVILANKILLKDFVLASTYGSEAVQSDSDYNFIALCEIANEGSIFLQEKESIKITLEDLVSAETYDLYGVEEPENTNELYFFEQKTVGSEEFNKKVDVAGNDLAIMTKDSTIDDVSYHFVNGQVVKYLPFELQTLSRDIDPIQAISPTGTVIQSLSDRLCLPLVAVHAIEINKSQGQIINFLVRTLKTV